MRVRFDSVLLLKLECESLLRKVHCFVMFLAQIQTLGALWAIFVSISQMAVGDFAKVIVENKLGKEGNRLLIVIGSNPHPLCLLVLIDDIRWL